jgi:CDP-paratose 2-epimerase
VEVTAAGEDRPGDVPVYLSDCAAVFAHTDWRPRRTPRDVLSDIDAWIAGHEAALGAAL